MYLMDYTFAPDDEPGDVTIRYDGTRYVNFALGYETERNTVVRMEVLLIEDESHRGDEGALDLS